MINHFRYHAGQFQKTFCQFEIKGPDALSFLHAQSTYDVKTLTTGSFHLTSFLDTQGKLDTYGWLIRTADCFFYLVPLSLKESSLERLQRYLVSEDVEITASESLWKIAVGESAREGGAGFSGEMFGDQSLLTQDDLSFPPISDEESELWRKLTGWPSFEGSDFSREIVNNTLLFDQAVSLKKGCYPGQETVSKIATHRGAAYSPVLLKSDSPLDAGPLFMEDKKIGEVTEALFWEGKYYGRARILRDFRVEGMKLLLPTAKVTVKYYPLLSGRSEDKASELFHAATNHFKNDQLKEAEELLKRAIKLDPKCADAYESLGVMLGRQERFPEAIELMRKLSEVDPDSVMAHTNMSLYLMRLGKIEEAEQEKSTATMKSFKKFGQEASSKRAAQEEQEKKNAEWAQREGLFNQVLEIDPEDTLANYGIGSIAVERGDWNKAKEHLEKVVAADPKYSVAYLALGKSYKALGLKDQAIEIFRKGIKIAAAKGDLMPANQMQMELEQI